LDGAGYLLKSLIFPLYAAFILIAYLYNIEINQKMNKIYFLVLAACILSFGAFAQVPLITGITGPTVTCSSPAPAAIYNATAINNPTSYAWYALPSTGVVITNGNSASASISFGGPAGSYTVFCSGSNSSGQGTVNAIVVNVFDTPKVTFSGNTNLFCQGSSTNLQASPTIYSASSTLSYSWTPSTGLNTTTGSVVIASPQVSTNYTVHIAMGVCKNTTQLFVNVNPFLVTIAPPSVTICNGSSTNLSANGSTSYTWSTGATGSMINVLPASSSNFTVTAIDTNGCVGSKIVAVTVDNTCSDVWPGDANSDGAVNSLDALELGYNYLATGAPRSVQGSNYSAHYATNWSGTLSSGKNKVHADCNGDGTVDLGDTLAIYNNFALTHSFRSSASVGESISLFSEYSNMVVPGEWNKLDIILGETSSSMDVYGVAFDIIYDNSMIENGQAYVKFTPSFLNANSQNVEFRKTNHAAGKIHVADIRTDGLDVNGSGKIGEFYFRVKQDIPEGVVVNTSVSNTHKAKQDRSLKPLTGNQLPLNVNKYPVSVAKNKAVIVNLYPNPVADKLTVILNSSEETRYSIQDITGRIVLEGSFVKSGEISTRGLAAGSYSIRLSSHDHNSTHKLLVK
jgi:hypothetical protein